MSDVTRILVAIEQGDAKAADELLPLVYEELRRLAGLKMSQELPGQASGDPSSRPRFPATVMRLVRFEEQYAYVAWQDSFQYRRHHPATSI